MGFDDSDSCPSATDTVVLCVEERMLRITSGEDEQLLQFTQRCERVCELAAPYEGVGVSEQRRTIEVQWVTPD